MSTKYKDSRYVPTSVLCDRLDELVYAIVARMNGNESKFDNEFTVRIPAECDRDADLVLSAASRRLRELSKEGDAWKKFKDMESECKELVDETPIERLRFFCSYAMKSQDWIDVEQLFDALNVTDNLVVTRLNPMSELMDIDDFTLHVMAFKKSKQRFVIVHQSGDNHVYNESNGRHNHIDEFEGWVPLPRYIKEE